MFIFLVWHDNCCVFVLSLGQKFALRSGWHLSPNPPSDFITILFYNTYAYSLATSKMPDARRQGAGPEAYWAYVARECGSISYLGQRRRWYFDGGSGSRKLLYKLHHLGNIEYVLWVKARSVSLMENVCKNGSIVTEGKKGGKKRLLKFLHRIYLRIITS